MLLKCDDRRVKVNGNAKNNNFFLVKSDNHSLKIHSHLPLYAHGLGDEFLFLWPFK